MKVQTNNNLSNWLGQLNGKTIDHIYQVDFNKDRYDDIYLPWLFFITFSDYDKFLEIEGDYDGEHIRIDLNDISQLENKLKENNLPDEQDLWQVYEATKDETIGRLLGRKVEFIEFGIDQDKFDMNGTITKEQKEAFGFLRFNSDKLTLTVFEGLGTGLEVSDDPSIKLFKEEALEKGTTK